MSKLDTSVDTNLATPPQSDVQTSTVPEALDRPMPLDQVIRAIHADSVTNPYQYLQETEVLDGGE